MPPRTKSTPDGREQRIAQLSSEIDLLKAQLMNSSLINELTKVMHSCTDLDGISKTLLLGIQEILQFDRVILFETNPETFSLRPRSSAGIDEKDINDLNIPLGFEGGEITDAIFLNRHLIVEKPDPTMDIFARRFKADNYLVIPVLSRATKKCWEHHQCSKTTCPAYGSYNPYCWSIAGSGESLNATSEDDRRRACVQCSCFRSVGALWMDRNQRKTPITSDDITTLTAVITQAGIILENSRILGELEKSNSSLSDANQKLNKVNHDLQVAQSKINNDLTHARTIQQGLLPQDLQGKDNLSIGARYIPALAVGGDYYDVFEITPGTYGLVVADVSGHGIASALIMSMAKILLKTYAMNKTSPQVTLEAINETFLTEIKTDNFVTIFYGILDTENRTFTYTSAGHCPVLFITKKDRTCRHVNADGLFLGVFPDMMLKETVLEYEPDQYRLVLYTDGLTETHNEDDEMFDISRLEKISLDTIDRSPKDTVEAILEFQRQFAGSGRQPEDDITLLVIDL